MACLEFIISYMDDVKRDFFSRTIICLFRNFNFFFIKESSQNFFHWNWNFTGETGINPTQIRRFEKMEKSAIVEKSKRTTYRLTAEFKEKNNLKIVELK